MKNIIPGAVLAIGMLGSSAFAEEQKINKESTKSSAVATLAIITGKKVAASVESTDSQQIERWRQNTEKLVADLLPGKPVSYHENGIQVIGYTMSGSNNGTRTYVGAFKSASDGANINYGVVVTIPIGR